MHSLSLLCALIARRNKSHITTQLINGYLDGQHRKTRGNAQIYIQRSVKIRSSLIKDRFPEGCTAPPPYDSGAKLNIEHFHFICPMPVYLVAFFTGPTKDHTLLCNGLYHPKVGDDRYRQRNYTMKSACTSV
jgi:hypothetical protein